MNLTDGPPPRQEILSARSLSGGEPGADKPELLPVATVNAMDRDDQKHFPLRQFLGMEIHSGERGHAIARVEVNPQLFNPNGVVHGGVMFTMADTAMGRATMSVLDDGQSCASIEVQMRFFRPASGGTLIADAAVIKSGRKIVHLEAKVRDGDGELIASGTGTFAVIS